MRRALVIAVFFGLVWPGLAVFGQVVTASCLSPPKEVQPGELVTHVFSLVNTGPAPLEVSLSLSYPPGWSLLTSLGTLDLAPGKEEIIFVTLAVPRRAQAGDYVLQLTARWPGGESVAEAKVGVKEIHSVELVPPRERKGLPGEKVAYTFTVANRGNAIDTFLVQASSGHGWSVDYSPASLTLAPQETGAIEVTVSIPPGTTVQRDPLTVTVTCEGRESVSARAIVFTKVLPPTPKLISGTVYAQLDACITAGISLDISGKGLGGDVSLSSTGTLLGGSISFGLTLSGPFSQHPLSVAGVHLLYDTDSYTVRAGSGLAARLSRLLAVNGSGLVADLKLKNTALSYFTGWRGTEGTAGLRAEVSKDQWRWGIAYRETRGEDHTGAACLWTQIPIAAGVVGFNEFGIGYQEPFTDLGFIGGMVISFPHSFWLQFDLSSVGPHFPSSRNDRRGISLSARLTAIPLTLRFSAAYLRDNVWGLATSPTVVHSSLDISFSWAPEKWPLSFTGGLSYDKSRDNSPFATTDTRDWQLSLGIAGGKSPLTFYLRGSWKDGRDNVSSVIYHDFTYQEGGEIRGKAVTLSLKLEQDASYDRSWTLISSEANTAVDVRISRPLGTLTLSWDCTADGGSLSLRGDCKLNGDFSLTPRLAASWDQGGELVSFTVGTDFSYRFTWAPWFLPAKGWVEGEAFIDLNENGQRDPAEPGIKGLVLKIGHIRVSTDETGAFKFPPLPPGKYQLEIAEKPWWAEPLSPPPYQVEVSVNGKSRVLIPCQGIGEIQGLVWQDADKDGKRQPDEPGIAGVKVTLIRAGQAIASRTTDHNGAVYFEDLPAASYTVELDPDSLPERYELTTPGKVTLKLSWGEIKEVRFGAWQRPKPVVITYQPPVADFSWQPEQPVVGQPVEFDGTASFDFDGTIVSYAWDFTGDGKPDATGPKVSWTFHTPGPHRVSLTVTDNDGYQDTYTQTVTVSPAAGP